MSGIRLNQSSKAAEDETAFEEMSDDEWARMKSEPRQTKLNHIDGRSMQRTDRDCQINIRASEPLIKEIKRLVLRDHLPSIAVFLEHAVAYYKQANPERSGGDGVVA